MTDFAESCAPHIVDDETARPSRSKDIILLKAKPSSKATEGRYKAFDETEFTRDVRQLLEDWTALYNAHDIRLDADETAERQRDARPVLRRYFTQGSFDRGGRYAGWWMDIKSEHREAIRIDAEPVIELDFRCCGPRLAYALQGIAVKPHNDLHGLGGKTGEKCPRALVKEAFLALLTTSSH